MKHFDIKQAKDVYSAGGNVTQHLRKSLNCDHNTPQIIELAYDLQAGSYIRGINSRLAHAREYACEQAALISPYLSPDKRILDVGTGELTVLSLLLRALDISLARVYALDISWSRLQVGMHFAREHLGEEVSRMDAFVADMGEIPLASKSVDVVTSTHALEPNGDNLKRLLLELSRVCRETFVLFEPSYELTSDAGRERMDRMGYIKDIEGEVTAIGGKVLSVTPLLNVDPMNPTACYIVKPPEANDTDTNVDDSTAQATPYTVPGTDYRLSKKSGFWYSEDTGLAFPELEGIPVLKSSAAILASALA